MNIFFICIWISFEYLHHVWVFNFPWLILGNVFGQTPQFVQWYQYTGVLGGSFWILCSNVSIYACIQKGKQKLGTKDIISLGCVCLLPMLISFPIYFWPRKETAEREISVAIIHTNFKTKDVLTDEEKLKIFFNIQVSQFAQNDYIVFPELFLDEFDTWMGEFKNSLKYSKLKKNALNNPKLKMVMGIFFNKEDAEGMHTDPNTNIRYSRYNTAIQIDTSKKILLKIKKIYVPFDEYLPAFARNFHISSTRYSQMPENSNSFKSGEIRAFISICYESINSIFYAQNWHNENLIFMLASEAFLKGSKIAMQQYLNICRLRAVETGKYIFKSSNGGLSAVITPKGDVQAFDGGEKQFVSYQTKGFVVEGNTFYTRSYGAINFLYPLGMITILFFSILGTPSRKTRRPS